MTDATVLRVRRIVATVALAGMLLALMMVLAGSAGAGQCWHTSRSRACMSLAECKASHSGYCRYREVANREVPRKRFRKPQDGRDPAPVPEPPQVPEPAPVPAPAASAAPIPIRTVRTVRAEPRIVPADPHFDTAAAEMAQAAPVQATAYQPEPVPLKALSFAWWAVWLGVAGIAIAARVWWVRGRRRITYRSR